MSLVVTIPGATVAAAKAHASVRLAAGSRFLCAWHSNFPRGILRVHSAEYFVRAWSGRRWGFFHGEAPTITDVSHTIEGLYEELFAGDLDPDALRDRWLQTRIVLRDGELHAQVSDPLPGVFDREGEPAIGLPDGIDLTESLDQGDVIYAVKGIPAKGSLPPFGPRGPDHLDLLARRRTLLDQRAQLQAEREEMGRLREYVRGSGRPSAAEFTALGDALADLTRQLAPLEWAIRFPRGGSA